MLVYLPVLLDAAADASLGLSLRRGLPREAVDVLDDDEIWDPGGIHGRCGSSPPPPPLEAAAVAIQTSRNKNTMI